MNATQQICSSLTSLRRDRGLSQQSFADAIGVDRTTVARWDIGLTVPKLEHLPAIAKALGIPVGELAEKMFAT